MMRLNLVLIVLIALAILGVEAWDRPAAAVEANVRRYAAAVSNADFDAAMAEVAPEARPTWSDWLRSQLGNVYDVTGVAVRAEWLLGRPLDVTVDLDINRGFEDEFYQANPRVNVEEVGGRWYLAAPLLAPTAEL